MKGGAKGSPCPGGTGHGGEPSLGWESIGLAKKFIWAFHKMLREDPNELLGQPNR